MPCRRHLAVAVLILLSTTLRTAELLQAVPGSVSGQAFSCLVHVPEGTPPTGGWPLLLSLHGFSLRGADLAQLETYGAPRAIRDGLRPGLVVVAPQMPTSRLLWDDGDLDRLLRWAVTTYGIDASRIYGTGVSLGAAGLWRLCAERRGWFAAMAPVAGSADADVGEACRDTPVWAFHGTADTTAPIVEQRATIAGHRRLGGDGRLTEFAGAGHGPFTREVFIDHALVAWLLTHRRRESIPPPVGRPPLPVAATPLPIRRWDGPLTLPSTATVVGWIGQLSRWNHRLPGSANSHAAEDWIEDHLRADGLAVQRQTIALTRWEPASGSLRIGGRALTCQPAMYTPFTGGAGLTAPLVAVGSGTRSDFEGASVSGKLVVIDARTSPTYTLDRDQCLFIQDPTDRFAKPVRRVSAPQNFLSDFAYNPLLKGLDAVRRAADAGAVGFLLILDGHAGAVASFGWPYDGIVEPIPGGFIAANDGDAVRAAARSGTTATLTTIGVLERGTMSNVYAVVPGRSQRAVLVGSHHDSPTRGVIEDATGTVAVLALARAYAAVPAAERPCDVVFLAAAGHFFKGEGAYRFTAAHPSLIHTCRAVLELEHLAGREVDIAPDGTYRNLTTRQPSTLLVSAHPEMSAIGRAALEAEPQSPITIERPVLGIPLTDAAGITTYARDMEIGGRSGLPYISWISTPPYLLDGGDTRDKLDEAEYTKALRCAAELLRRLVALPETYNRTRRIELLNPAGRQWVHLPDEGVPAVDAAETRIDGLSTDQTYELVPAPTALGVRP